MAECPRCAYDDEELSERDVEEGILCEACMLECAGEGDEE